MIGRKQMADFLAQVLLANIPTSSINLIGTFTEVISFLLGTKS